MLTDYVEKKANIYFDYNFPIETNKAETLFEALSVVNPVLDTIISIYPNPVKDIVNITIKDNSIIKTIETALKRFETIENFLAPKFEKRG